MLTRASGQHQIASLASQVTELAEVNKTLRKYLEEVVSKVVPDEAAKLIKTESRRLEETTQDAEVLRSTVGGFLSRELKLSPREIRNALLEAGSIKEFAKRVAPKGDAIRLFAPTRLAENPAFIKDVNFLRQQLGMKPWPLKSSPASETAKRKRVVLRTRVDSDSASSHSPPKN